MPSKKCSKCGKLTDFDGFHSTSRSRDGKVSACKLCVSAYQRERFLKIKADPERFEKHRTQVREWLRAKRAADPVFRRRKSSSEEQHLAHVEVLKAQQRGELHPQPCEVCGATKVDGHHDDYSKPLEVRWLCRQHHQDHHRQQKAQADSVGLG